MLYTWMDYIHLPSDEMTTDVGPLKDKTATDDEPWSDKTAADDEMPSDETALMPMR